MMQPLLFDDEVRQNLLPFTFTRPVAGIRIGILTIQEKWEKYLGTSCGFITRSYLSKKYPFKDSDQNLLINGSVLPDNKLLAAMKGLTKGMRLVKEGKVLAAVTGKIEPGYDVVKDHSLKDQEYPGTFTSISHNWDIFAKNETAIKEDFDLITKGRKSAPLSDTNHVLNPENVFLETGARVECAFLNASSGPVYIGRDSEVMEGAMIRGPFSLGDHSVVKMGAKIYTATTIGPHCRVGGEINNSVVFGYSNKAHDGFMGNSVIGEWCNLGADTNNSNLKNNYSIVKMWDYGQEDYVSTGLQFCGLMMGDHSKCSINTMFNTGTVVGVSANIFGTGFPPKLVPSFSWGGSEGFANYKLHEAMEVAQRVYERRDLAFNAVEQDIFKYLFDESTRHRAW
jgi:UDP-N-acetylglucosamine diphosphorylase/glucosamine-1-phosphate N-acetyltransferase